MLHLGVRVVMEALNCDVHIDFSTLLVSRTLGRGYNYESFGSFLDPCSLGRDLNQLRIGFLLLMNMGLLNNPIQHSSKNFHLDRLLHRHHLSPPHPGHLVRYFFLQYIEPRTVGKSPWRMSKYLLVRRDPSCVMVTKR